jgi:hypothetical protein
MYEPQRFEAVAGFLDEEALQLCGWVGLLRM